jgi:Dyp-type peroxidase family
MVNEPVLAVKEIQGNILAGFNKDQQTLLFLRITDPDDFRRWLGELIPFIATTAEVISFNRLFKEIRRRRKAETRTVLATWVNVALSYTALEALVPEGTDLRRKARELGLDNYDDAIRDSGLPFSVADFADEAFRQGMSARAVSVLADPACPDSEGNPANWVLGGPNNATDVVIIVASDSPLELATEVARLEETIYSGRSRSGTAANSGVVIVHKQQGATLPPPLTGHEHFGFLDGVSQPGIRGLLSSDPNDVLTLRQNPLDPNQGKPGQDLIWPGEFVFGYPGQDGEAADITVPGPDSLAGAGPAWAKDGSYLVIRRLRQDVDRFHRFLEAQSEQLGISAGLFGAKLVGRWKSGAPVLRAGDVDNPPLAEDDCANNHFEFQDASDPIPAQPAVNGCTVPAAYCEDTRFAPSPGDPAGALCPFAGHIRKTYPRDDTGTLAPQIGEVTTQTHRLLRRGIPFGEPFFAAKDPERSTDSGNRGLVFAAYQTSIVEQFEFVQSSWANNPDFKDVPDATGVVSGHDLIIGQTNNSDGTRTRACRMTLPGGDATITAPVDWVHPTGGGYFFAPSFSALCLLTGVRR